MLMTDIGNLTLKFTYNSMAEYEEKFNRSMLLDAKNTTLPVIRRLVWAGLLHYPRGGFSLQQVGDLIEQAILNGADMIDIQKEISQAIDDAVFLQRLVEKSAQRQAKN